MDLFEKSLREDHRQRRSNGRRETNPSFSSTLLDAIYRSIDESNGSKGGAGEELIYYRENMRKKQHSNGLATKERDSSMRKACMVEEWIEKKVVRRKSMADRTSPAVLLNSSSSSSESSCGGGFSSSESDSMYGSEKPKPIRTSISASAAERKKYACVSTQKQQQQPKSEGGFVRTKSKALKIYSDLKKVKQPISPGGRLASFLNSLFTSGNAKKAKTLKPEPESTCSSVSSFSRSCLSKTPSSSRGKLSNGAGAKRSVRFCPVSVIVDEDCRPCGHKNLYENEQRKTAYHHINNEELQYHVKSESQRVEEAARELLKNYQKKKEEEFDQMRGICINEEEEEEDDAASFASSDLFELDNLSAIGIERYREELPVYETTHHPTNRAIANGLIL